MGGNLAHDALMGGEIDLYVEYTGTGLLAILKERPLADPQEVYQRVKSEYAKRSISWEPADRQLPNRKSANPGLIVRLLSENWLPRDPNKPSHVNAKQLSLLGMLGSAWLLCGLQLDS